MFLSRPCIFQDFFSFGYLKSFPDFYSLLQQFQLSQTPVFVQSGKETSNLMFYSVWTLQILTLKRVLVLLWTLLFLLIKADSLFWALLDHIGLLSFFLAVFPQTVFFLSLLPFSFFFFSLSVSSFASVLFFCVENRLSPWKLITKLLKHYFTSPPLNPQPPIPLQTQLNFLLKI